MPKIKVVQVSRPGGPLEVVERELAEPAAGEVQLKVEACGICHSDTLVREGGWPGMKYPRVPGHEVVGIIEAIGAGVTGFSRGERVGVGWYGGHDGRCDPCRRGQLFACKNGAVTGLTFDGGYAERMNVVAMALARVPDGLDPLDAAPLMCAGVTTFNALRTAEAREGSLVAVLGIGGLGHLAVQYAVKLGYQTVAIARGRDKEALAKKLGAHHYLDTTACDPAAELQRLGGASAILATVSSGEAMSVVTGGLDVEGTLLVIGAGGVLQVTPFVLITGRRSIKGAWSGLAIDSEDALAFSLRMGVRPMVETFPLDRVGEAYDRMLSGKARFRVLLKMAR
jgi:alcohol dehydrogenase/propanol-preferring alcohol dehydrogenase